MREELVKDEGVGESSDRELCVLLWCFFNYVC